MTVSEKKESNTLKDSPCKSIYKGHTVHCFVFIITNPYHNQWSWWKQIILLAKATCVNEKYPFRVRFSQFIARELLEIRG